MEAESPFNGDFARLIPRNPLAQVLFSDAIAYVDKNDTFHLQFMERTLNEPESGMNESPDDSSEFESHADAESDDPRLRAMHSSGHYVFSFDKQRAPAIPHLGWRVGRGTRKVPIDRGVDILLAKPGHTLGKRLASIHLLFRFNLKSGFLMLSAESQKASVEVKVGTSWERLEHKEERLIHQPATMLRAGLCEYEFEYNVDEKDREAYFESRNAFLEPLRPSNDGVARTFQKLPGDSCVLRGKYLEFGTQGSGAFGWITQGVDIRTGDPVAIKELRINNKTSRKESLHEVEMGKRFFDQRGLLPVLDSWCEHGQNNACCDLEKFYIFMPHAQSDLAVKFWSSPDIPRVNKLQWLKELVEGLAALHDMGIMHRDIRPKNMLIMTTSPPRAAICDFGKAIQAQTDTVTTIGPVSTLAPEVWSVKRDGPYNDKVDAWAFGYAMADIMGYSVAKYPGLDGFTSHNPAITPNRHAAILQMLRRHARKKDEDAAVVDLAMKLLRWDPSERWSAKQALEHECWDPISLEESFTDEGMQSATELGDEVPTKKARTSSTLETYTGLLAEATTPWPTTQATQEFSAETKARLELKYQQRKRS